MRGKTEALLPGQLLREKAVLNVTGEGEFLLETLLLLLAFDRSQFFDRRGDEVSVRLEHGEVRGVESFASDRVQNLEDSDFSSRSQERNTKDGAGAESRLLVGLPIKSRVGIGIRHQQGLAVLQDPPGDSFAAWNHDALRAALISLAIRRDDEFQRAIRIDQEKRGGFGIHYPPRNVEHRGEEFVRFRDAVDQGTDFYEPLVEIQLVLEA